MKPLKFLLLSSLALVVLNGCMNDSSDRESETDTVGTTIPADSALLNESPIQQLPYVVNYDDASGRLEIDKNPESDSLTLNREGLILALKNKYPEINLRLGERRKDTLEVYIDDATYLTQSIGSAGASAFLAETTFAFTSLDSVKVVNFKFEPGDHAMPGPYDRRYFKDFH